MSNKPLKASDQKKLADIVQRKQKRTEALQLLPPYTVIFCEGTKTEPLYIQGLANRVNDKYKDFVKKDRVVIEGTGRNTQDLLRFARKTVESKYPNCQIAYLMYDKDDFPSDNFDNTQFSAEKRKDNREYRVAWSNECIELWFVLHFQDLESNVHRSQYREILKGHFPYEKNLEDLYDLLCDKTPSAIKRSRELYESYEPDTPPSKRAPATRVHELVEYLSEYL